MAFDTFDQGLNINPSPDQVERFLSLDQNATQTFVNFHEYHPRAQYPQGYASAEFPPDVSGQEAYRRYLVAVERDFLSREPGSALVVKPVEFVMVGDGNWHEMVIGFYPTRAAAMRIAAMPGYADILVHRTAALKAVLTVSVPGHIAI